MPHQKIQDGKEGNAMRTNGRMMKCDRCGEETFCKCTGEGEMDGGFTRWNKFEEAEGWSSECGIGDLCPECTQEYKRLKEEFASKVERFKGGASNG